LGIAIVVCRANLRNKSDGARGFIQLPELQKGVIPLH